MGRKTLTVGMAIFLIFLSVSPCFARGPTISVGAAAGMQGETISIPVRIEGNPGINTFSLGFEYDASKITLLDASPAPNLGGHFAYKRKAVWLNNKNIRYNGEILYLKFQIKQNAVASDTEVRVTYSPGEISNYEERNINFSTSSGVVLIGITKNSLDRFLKIASSLIIKITLFANIKTQ